MKTLQETPLWLSLSELYDYGIYGVLPTVNKLGDGSLFDVEMFLDGIDGLAQYLQEDDGGIPELSKSTIELARCRRLLDEGAASDPFTLTQIAMLVNVDETRLRQFLSLDVNGVICVDAVRQWLSGCPGFSPTGNRKAPEFTFARTFSMDLPVDVIRAIQERAGRTKKAPFDVLRDAFAMEIVRDPLYASNSRCDPRASVAQTA
jgi:hypothetical protein